MKSYALKNREWFTKEVVFGNPALSVELSYLREAGGGNGNGGKQEWEGGARLAAGKPCFYLSSA